MTTSPETPDTTYAVTHSDGCWQWHPACAYERGRADERERVAAAVEARDRWERDDDYYPQAYLDGYSDALTEAARVAREADDGR